MGMASISSPIANLITVKWQISSQLILQLIFAEKLEQQQQKRVKAFQMSNTAHLLP